MLQRTRAEQVEPVYTEFTLRYKLPQDYLEDPESNTFVNLGLPERNKQFKLLNSIITINGIPEEKVLLLQLPGVGDYIASAYQSLYLGIRASLIDSNIVRVYGRYFGFETDPETRRKKWLIELVGNITPKRKYREYNYALIDFSRAICKTSPNCGECPVRRKCQYYSIN